MKRGKFEAPAAKRVGIKSTAMILVLVMVFCGVIGGTVAWLIDQTAEVKNTFTYGDINIRLDETDIDEDGTPSTDPESGDPIRKEEGNEYEMIPGEDIFKDPMVTVLAESENCWLFVKLEKSDNFDDFLTYTIAQGWAQLYDAEGNEVEGVYYRYQGTRQTDEVYSVLEGDKVTVLDSVTKEMLNELDADSAADYPTLTVTAYAVQYSGFEPEITDGATAPTDTQVNDAAYTAWTAANS